MKWELDEAIKFIRGFEVLIRPLKHYTALTGSVLYDGKSDNDLDIIIAPLNEQTGYDDRCDVIKLLNELFRTTSIGKDNYGSTDREVYTGDYYGKKIDFIFFF